MICSPQSSFPGVPALRHLLAAKPRNPIRKGNYEQTGVIFVVLRAHSKRSPTETTQWRDKQWDLTMVNQLLYAELG